MDIDKVKTAISAFFERVADDYAADVSGPQLHEDGTPRVSNCMLNDADVISLQDEPRSEL